jgi:hypothetical protein
MILTVNNGLLQLDDVPRNRVGSCHGRPLRELKLWWTKVCEVSSYATYEMTGNRFAQLRRQRHTVEGW